MKTEREKMTQGEPYRNGDPQLMLDKKRARTVAGQYNCSSEEEEELRAELLQQLFGSCGVNAFIKPPFHCDYGYNIHIGDNFFANFDCVILDAAPVYIGDHCMLGPKTCIFAVNHPINPIERNDGIACGKPVHIGNNVWLGGNCTVLPGVTIGDNVVVGAGSVVTKDIPDNVVVAGNPAKMIRYIEEEK